jgi:hypothetical protein
MDEAPLIMYHYTTEKGMQGILASGQINPSLWTPNTKDVRLGEGVYLTNIPPGTKSNVGLALSFKGVPNPNLYTNYVAINVRGLPVKGELDRPNVFVVPTTVPLGIKTRLRGGGGELNNGSTFMKYVHISEFYDSGHYCDYYYEVDAHDKVRRSAYFNLETGDIIWDAVEAHADDGSLFGDHSCIEGPFPRREVFTSGGLQYEDITEEDFARHFEEAKSKGRGPFDARRDEYPHR